MKTKRKRKLHVRNILILCVAFLAVIAGIVLAVWIPKYQDQKEQEARQQVLSEKLEERSAFVKAVNETSAGSTDPEVFASIQKLALAENADVYQGLEGLVGQRIDDEKIRQIEALKPQEDGSRFLDVLQKADQIDPYWLLFLSKDDDRIDFVEQYFNQGAYQNAPAELTESLESVPELLQWDMRWGYIPYGDMNIAFAGCAPTTLSMVASYLKQDPAITPVAVAKLAEANGDYVNGAGSAYTIFDHTAEHYGLQMSGVNPDEQSIAQALQEGKVLLIHVVPGKFTTVGHFMLITGIEDGKYQIHDPNSIKNTKKLWDPKDVLEDTDLIWGFSK